MQISARLEMNVTFTIELKLIEQNPSDVMSALEKAAAKLSCDLEDSYYEDETGEVVR